MSRHLNVNWPFHISQADSLCIESQLGSWDVKAAAVGMRVVAMPRLGQFNDVSVYCTPTRQKQPVTPVQMLMKQSEVSGNLLRDVPSPGGNSESSEQLALAEGSPLRQLYSDSGAILCSTCIIGVYRHSSADDTYCIQLLASALALSY